MSPKTTKQQLFEVEKILNHDPLKAIMKSKIKYYYVKWLGTKRRLIQSKKRRKENDEDKNDALSFENNANDQNIQQSPKPQTDSTNGSVNPDFEINVSDKRYSNFMINLSELFEREAVQQMNVSDIVSQLDHEFTSGEVNFCLEKMMEDNKIFLTEGICFLV